MKNFCYMPWRELYVEHGGTLVYPKKKPGYLSCCIQNYKSMAPGNPFTEPADFFNSDKTLNSIRKQFLEDKRPKECSTCWNSEDSGGVSKRIEFNKKYKALYPNITPQDPPNLEELDIRLSNKCNLQCKMCFSGCSDQIAKNIVKATNAGAIDDVEFAVEEEAEYWSEHSNVNPIVGLYDFIMRNKTVKRIKFAGGEPFVMPQVEELLEKLIDAGRTDLDIFFLTNCTTVKDSMLEMLSKFDRSGVGCSIDGVGKWIEYQRYPAQWKAVKRNLNKLLKHKRRMGQGKFDIDILPCWSQLNVLGLADFFKWLKEEKVLAVVNFTEVEYPSYLNWTLIPLKYRTELIKELGNIKWPRSIRSSQQNYDSLVERLATEVREITPEEREKLKTMVQVWDFNNPIKYRDMFPWGKELLGE